MISSGARFASCSYLCVRHCAVPSGSLARKLLFQNFVPSNKLDLRLLRAEHREADTRVLLRGSLPRSLQSIETKAMDEFSVISDHSLPLQGHGMFGGSSAALSTGSGKTVPTQDDRNGLGIDTLFPDWPQLLGFDDLDAAGLRNSDPTFEIGSNYFKDILRSSNCSPEPQLARSDYFDDVDFSIDGNDSNTLKVNTTETMQQSRRNGASSSGTPSRYGEHASGSSSGVSDAELSLPFDDIAALASEIGLREGLEAILSPSPSPSPEMRAPAAPSTMGTDGSSTCSGRDIVVTAAQVPRTATVTKDPFNGAPDMILEEMAGNPLDMYFPPLTAYEQPEMPVRDTTSSAPKHRFPEEFPGSSALDCCAELQFCSEDTTSAGLHGQSSSEVVVLDAVPVKDLCFRKLQGGINQVDLAARGRIRDSLYRLANSLEQRHGVARTSAGLGSSGSKRFRSGGWAETTQTNAMDQSVAQLLLQKPYYRKPAAAVPPHRVP